jgi:RNA-binding protein 39
VECNQKYGKVVHIAVDANSDGEIFVNGRNFNFRTIRASYVVDKVYNSLYGAAAAF